MPGTKISAKSLELLKRGIELAKSNQKSRARRLFREAVYDEPRNEMAWLWLASVAESPREAMASIDQALAINPRHRAAEDWLLRLQRQAAQSQKAAESQQPEPAVPSAQAIGYLDLGRLREALGYLRAASDLQPNNERLKGMVGRLSNRLQAATRGSPDSQPTAFVEEESAPANSTIHSFWPPQAIDVEQDSTATNQAAPPKTGATQPSPKPACSPRRGTVLIADDDAETRSIVVETLVPLGYRVLEATSGLEAMARLQQTVPDLILLSSSLGQLDGYQAFRLIKSNELTQSIPVVLLRLSGDFLGTLRSRLSRVDLTLTKPLRPSQLEQTLVRLFGKSGPQGSESSASKQ